jgi:uncharacterized protein YggE
MDTKAGTSTNRIAITAAVLALMACLMAAFLLGRQPQPRNEASAMTMMNGIDSSRTISVSGTAEQRIAPDRASLEFVVTTQNKNPSAAQLENEQIAAKVIKAIRDAGGSAAEINPGGLEIAEEVRSEQDPTIPVLEREVRIDVKYTVVTSSVTIVTGKLANVGKYVRGAFDAGATTGNVRFSTTKLRKLSDDARAAAMKAAVDKAGALTKISGSKRGEVLSIQLGEVGTQNFQYRDRDSRVRNTQNSIDIVPSAESPTEMGDQFGGGMITVSASVTATFAIVSV